MKKFLYIMAALIIITLGACSANTKVQPTSSSTSTPTSTSIVSTYNNCKDADTVCDHLMYGYYIPTDAEKFMAADAYATFKAPLTGFTEAEMKASFDATYIGTFSNDPHYKDTVTVPSIKYPTAYYHTFSVSK